MRPFMKFMYLIFQILLKIVKNIFLVLMNIVSCHSTKNQLFFSFANAAIVVTSPVHKSIEIYLKISVWCLLFNDCKSAKCA